MAGSEMDTTLESNTTHQGWNRFWFSPGGDRFVSALRVAVGILALIWIYSLSADISRWFGPHGLLPDESVHAVLESRGADENHWRYTYLIGSNSENLLWTAHVISFAMITAFAIGFGTQVTSVGTFLVIVCYIHRAPMLGGPFENVLSFVVGYLAIGLCGSHFSLDAKLRRIPSDTSPSGSIRSNLALRLIQVHLCLVYLYSFLSKLNGDVWWQGESVWWLAVQPDTALVDVTSIAGNELAMNLWTYGILATEFSMAVLIWFKPLRPYLVGLSVLMWISLIPISGETLYCVLMMMMSSVFLYSSRAASR